MTHQAVAEVVGRSRAAVANLIRLLDLPAEVVAMVDSKALGMGHARALLGLEDDAERVRLARYVVERQLSVRATQDPGPQNPRREGQGTLRYAPRLVGGQRSVEYPRGAAAVTAEVGRRE